MGRLRRLRPVALLAIGGVAFYVLLPSLLAVFGSWRSLSHLDWRFAALVPGCEAASLVCLWELDRIALRTPAWLPVIAAQLTGNAAGRVFPGGGATATAVSASVLRRAGIDTSEAAAGFATSTLLQLATTLALPVLALPAIVGVRKSTAVSRPPPISAQPCSCCYLRRVPSSSHWIDRSPSSAVRRNGS